MTLVWLILGGLACVVIGVVAGYKYCSWISGNIFQALIDQGKMVIKTEDGWMGQWGAIKEVATQCNATRQEGAG